MIYSDDAPLNIKWRREVVFLVLAGLFLGSLTMLNILGISRFIDLSFEVFGLKIPFILAVGVLPYPITFLCTDFISEIYGKKRANLVVWIGLLLNMWVLFVLWLGGSLDAPETLTNDGTLPLLVDENGMASAPHGYAFYEIRKLTFGATFASMIAYLSAQFIDVHVFHYLKNLTKGKMLWLRNNGSTLTSQLVDSVAVILITHFYANALPINEAEPLMGQLLIFIFSGYIFKMVIALLDTIPFYLGTSFLKNYLRVL